MKSSVAQMGKKKERKIIEIPVPEEVVLRVNLEGLSPLIIHAFSEKAWKQMEAAQQGKATTSKKKARNPKADYEAAFYRDGDGDACIKNICIKAAMLKAYKAAGLRDTTSIRQGCFVHGRLTKIEGGKPKMRTDTVRNSGVGNTADLRYRPEWQKWNVTLEWTVNLDILTLAQFVNVLVHAGSGCGIGELRPQKTAGDYGRFRVVSCEEIES